MKNIKYFFISIWVSLFLIPSVFAGCDGWFTFSSNCDTQLPYCSWSGCWLWQWFLASIRAVWDNLSHEPISQLAQDMVSYFLSFVSLVAVIYIIYAGFQLMISAGDEEKMKKTKNIILYVVAGILIMWLSYGIVKWIIDLVGVGSK